MLSYFQCYTVVLVNCIVLINSTILYVNVSSDTVWAVNATTVAGLSNGTAGSTNSTLNSPRGITISNDDILYIAEWNNARIVVVNLTSSQVINIIGSGPGTGINQFDHSYDVLLVDTSIYVLDSWNRRIQKWSKTGTNPMTLPGAQSFGYGFYIFLDKYGNLYVSVYYSQVVVRFASNSSIPVTIAGTGTAGSLSNQLYSPGGIYVDSNLTLYIADHDNHRVQMWKYGATSGRIVAGTGTTGSSLSELDRPTSVLADQNGYMYITDEGNDRVLRWKINAASGVCIASCTGQTGIGMNQLYAPVSLAFDSHGSLYVSDYFNHRIQKFQIIPNSNNQTTRSSTTVKTSRLSSPVSTIKTTLHLNSTLPQSTPSEGFIVSTTNSDIMMISTATILAETMMGYYFIFMIFYYTE